MRGACGHRRRGGSQPFGCVVGRELDVVPERVQERVETSARLLLAARQIVEELGFRLKEGGGLSADVAYVRDLQAYPEVIRVKDLVLAASEELPAERSNVRLDRDFLRGVPWQLDRFLAPKHSIHF